MVGSIPTLVIPTLVLIAFLTLMRYLSYSLLAKAEVSKKEGMPMKTSFFKRSIVLLASMIETIWAITVGYLAGYALA